MRADKNTANWTWRTAAVLIGLVLLTSALASGIMARYTMSADTGDGARVAAYVFSINDENPTQLATLSNIQQPGDSQTYVFSVTNQANGAVAEVAQTYTIEAEQIGNLPLTITLQKLDTDGTTVLAADPRLLSDEFPAGEARTVTYRLTVEWPAEEKTYIDDGLSVVRLTVSSLQKD